MQKNVAGQKWVVFAFDLTDNTPKTGDAANITANLRIDGGAANAVDDTNPVELEDGYYVFDITQVESNGEMILISPVSSTSNIQVIGVPGVVFTSPPNFPDLGIESDGDLTKVNTLNGHAAQTGDNFARLGAPAGASVSADIAAVKAAQITVADILTTAMTESYAADGAAPTIAQALCLIQQTIGDFSVSGTTLTAKKLDGSTTAATYTLDDAANPTSRTRAT